MSTLGFVLVCGLRFILLNVYYETNKLNPNVMQQVVVVYQILFSWEKL